MATTWAQMLPLLKLHITGCPDPVLSDMIRRVTIDFCEKTKIYRLDADSISIVSGTSEYTPAFAGENVTPIGVHHAYLGTDEVYETSEMMLRNSITEWRLETGTPTHYLLLASNKLKTFPVPNADLTDTLEVNFVVKPNLSATGIPDYIYNDYGFQIVEGAAYFLKRIADKPWSNPAEAVEHYREYRRGIASARKVFLKNKGLMQSNAVNPQPFGGICVWGGATSFTEFE